MKKKTHWLECHKKKRENVADGCGVCADVGASQLPGRCCDPSGTNPSSRSKRAAAASRSP